MRFYRIRKFPTRLIVILVIALVIFFNSSLRTGFKKFIFEISYIPSKITQNAKGLFANTQQLREENLDLKRRVGELSVELSRMKQNESRIDRLEELLSLKKSLKHETEASRVLARDIGGFRKFLIINKGSSSNIKDNTPCVSADGIVGNIVEVSPNTAKVMLITDPASRIGVTIRGSGENGLLVGSATGECRVIYLDIDKDVPEGSVVITSGLSSLFPEGLPVGTVASVGIESTKLYKYAEISPYVEPGKIKEVLSINIGEK